MNSTLLTKEEIDMLNMEKRIGFTFAFIIFTFGILGTGCYLGISKAPSIPIIIAIDSIILILTAWIPKILNKEINEDLKANTKQLLEREVEKKTEEVCCEPGSGNLYIPILGNLFPKLWGQKMRNVKLYYIEAARYRHKVDKTTYDSVKKGDAILVHFAKNSGMVLGLSKK